ncbi:hypothetical protein L917_01302, partial [Phytophthora nicotianae]
MGDYQELVSSQSQTNTVAGVATFRRRKIEIEVVENASRGPTWEFPGFGSSQRLYIPATDLANIQLSQSRTLLSEWLATAIIGNDFLGSVLYSVSNVAAKSGKLTPVPLLMVSIVVQLYKLMYAEVITAIPMNGGTYNALLNTTSKPIATVAACLGILSYVATATVAAISAVHYLSTQVNIPTVACTIAILLAFGLLALLGIVANSRAALAIFLHHIVVLSTLAISCVIYGIQNPTVFRENMQTEFPDVIIAGKMLDGSAFTAVFFGFGAAMLGITGFESSSNYVEEQASGVFRKTLRNAALPTTIFNISLGIGILAVVPLGGDDGIYANADALLSKAAEVALGSWFSIWVSVDAFIVLSGSVLTSYVGICGLVRRLATDRVLPSFLAKTNQLRGTNHYIIAAFFLLSASLVLILNADSTIMNGVYTYAFLGLMALFASAAMLLKAKRPEIPRDVIAP